MALGGARCSDKLEGMRLAGDEQNRRCWNDAAQHHAQRTHFNGVTQWRACTVHRHSRHVPRIQCTAAHGFPHHSLRRRWCLLFKKQVNQDTAGSPRRHCCRLYEGLVACCDGPLGAVRLLERPS